jgi:hypothetical protein
MWLTVRHLLLQRALGEREFLQDGYTSRWLLDLSALIATCLSNLTSLVFFALVFSFSRGGRVTAESVIRISFAHCKPLLAQ